MSNPAKQAGLVGLVALSVALMVFSYFRAFHASPPPPSTAEAPKYRAMMEALWKNDAGAQPKGRAGVSPSPSAPAAKESKAR